ncbi:MAG TPA: DUF222 domain-containing protein [Ilumatobacter sp.]|nr:DUF222 domain-containing protein [Ilumatobacter sp.]
MVPAPAALLEALGSVDLSGADAVMCNRLLTQVKQVQGWVDAFRAQVTSRLDALATTGESFGSESSNSRCSGMSGREAGKQKERAKALDQADGFGDALATGEVTAEHVDKLAGVASSLSDEVKASLFERSDELLEHAKSNDPGRFGRHARDLARTLERDAGIARDRQQRRDTYLSWKVAADGMYDLHARLHPELGARVVNALTLEVAAAVARGEASGDPDFVNRTVNRNRLMAEALGDLLAGGHQAIRPVEADLSVHVDAHTLATGEFHDHSVCETSHGAPLSIESVRALLCSGRLTPVITGPDGTVLNVGRTTRTANRQQRRALRAMYRTCAAAGCDVPFDRCHIHHILEWELFGPTDLQNLLPLCARHHHLVHALRWRLRLDPDRTLTVTDHHGEVIMRTTPDMPHPARRVGLTGRHERRTRPAEPTQREVVSTGSTTRNQR